VTARHAELRRLRALVAIGARDAERGDARVAEEEDDVARRDLAHGLVEGIAGFVSVALGRTDVAAGHVMAFARPISTIHQWSTSSPAIPTARIHLSAFGPT
jgi:hypothetical protein